MPLKMPKYAEKICDMHTLLKYAAIAYSRFSDMPMQLSVVFHKIVIIAIGKSITDIYIQRGISSTNTSTMFQKVSSTSAILKEVLAIRSVPVQYCDINNPGSVN